MTQNAFEKFHLLTEAQYEQETKSPNDIYAVAMSPITPGEIIVKGFQGDMPTTLTEPQKAAARAFFGIPVLGATGSHTHVNNNGELVADPIGVVINSSDPTVKEAEMINGELMDVKTSMPATPVDNELLTAKAIKNAIDDAIPEVPSLTHETWTFTLDDGTNVTKEVTLWT